MRHDFDDGKYTVIFDEKTGKMEALRHGEPWQDLSGNNLVYFMLSAYDSTRLETAQLQAHVAELEAALRPALEFVETFSNRWDGQRGRHPWGVVQDARKALGAE